jgi:hypothetical protein
MTQTLELQINQFDAQLEHLYSQIAEIKQQKREAVAKKRIAEKALAKLKLAVGDVFELSKELGQEFAQSAIAIVKNVIPDLNEKTIQSNDEQVASNCLLLVTRYLLLQDGRHKQKLDNSSNELYAWQPTLNPNVASYFNLKAEKIHCTYLGAKTKAIANQLAVKIRTWFTGTSLEIRAGERLDSKYELKVNGLQDKHIQWLVEQDFENLSDWEYPEHLFPRATIKERSLAASINEPLLKKGIKVFNPKNNTEYILQSWGNMRAEVYDPQSNQTFMHYLTNLELIA